VAEQPLVVEAPLVLEERVGAVAVLRLNRAEARNAVNAAMAQAIVDAFARAQDAGAIVLTGADPAFCAGLDLRNLGIERLFDIPNFIGAPAESAVPVIAAVNGAAATGGLEMALSCEFIIASEQARFADTHLRVGVYPGPVLVDLPRRVGIAWARQMSLTGEFVDAATALRIGLANEVVPHEQLLSRAIELATAIAVRPAGMVRVMRQDWAATSGLPVADAHRLHSLAAREHGFTQTDSAALAANSVNVLKKNA
jgi:enoyl-CoA hydratase